MKSPSSPFAPCSFLNELMAFYNKHSPCLCALTSLAVSLSPFLPCQGLPRRSLSLTAPQPPPPPPPLFIPYEHQLVCESSLPQFLTLRSTPTPPPPPPTPLLQTRLYCLVGLVVKASASRMEDPCFESSLRRDFSRVESNH